MIIEVVRPQSRNIGMPLDNDDVIILDSSPKQPWKAEPAKQVNVIELISDDDEDELPQVHIASQRAVPPPAVVQIEDTEMTEPLQDRIKRILEQSKTIPLSNAGNRDSMGSLNGSRDSFFESFYQKWVVKGGKDEYEAEEEAILSQSVKDVVMIDDKGKTPVAKRPRKTPAAPKSTKSFGPSTPAQVPRPAPVIDDSPRVVLGKAPKTKDEACLELTMQIDDRLNRRLEIVPQMSTTFRINIERLDDQGEIRWVRTINGTSMPCSIMALVLDCETHGVQIEADPERFIATVKGRIPNPQRFSQIYLIITGFKAFGSKLATRINKSFREAVLTGERIPSANRANMAGIQATWQEIEQRLWIATTSIINGDSQCPFRIVFHETAQLTRQFLFEMCRDIAWLPYNTNSLAGRFNFCTIGQSTTNGIKRNGDGPDETFRMMLCQIRMITPQLALSITRVYPTFQSLMQAYKNLPPNDGAALLQNIPTGSGRGIGQVLSARVYKVFTGRDPDQFVK